MIEIRKATAADEENILEYGRNHPLCREYR